MIESEYQVCLRRLEPKYFIDKWEWRELLEEPEIFAFTNLEDAIKCFNETDVKPHMDGCFLVPMLDYGVSCKIEHWVSEEYGLEYDYEFDKEEIYFKCSEIPVFGQEACYNLVDEIEQKLNTLGYNYQIDFSGAAQSYETFYIILHPIDEENTNSFEIRVSNHDSNHGNSNSMIWLSGYSSIDSLFDDIIGSVNEPELYSEIKENDLLSNLDNTKNQLEHVNKKHEGLKSVGNKSR